MNNIHTKHKSIFFIFILLIGAGWIWLSATPENSTTSGAIPAPQEGFLAPDFTLNTLAGETIQLSELRGQPVLINIWASWCPPCRTEMPAMQRVYRDFKEQGFVILAVNATNQDTATKAADFVADKHLNFPILMDTDGTVSRNYQISSLPTSFFVGRDGIIREMVIGGMSETLIRTRVENLFEETP
ncbi:MAG: TlpA family protein disulfide reductase [Anaerolineae bacterium]|nr:TlpA family protein disulfide reductase [Anaerolineae bacterium]